MPVSLSSLALALSGGLLAVALGGIGLIVILLLRGDGTDGLLTGQALTDRVARAMEQAESFRVEFPGPSGNGDDPSDVTVEFIRPDRWRQTLIYKGEEDCPRQFIILGDTEYSRDPCEDQVWRSRRVDPGEYFDSALVFVNFVVPTLDAMIDPQTRLATMADGREVLVASGMLDYARFTSHFPTPESDATPQPTEVPPSVRAEVRLLADTYLPLEVVFHIVDEPTSSYRFTNWNAITPIEAPRPGRADSDAASDALAHAHQEH